MAKIVIEDNQLRLPDDRIITFNDQQYEAIQLIRKWLKEANGLNNVFTLSGSAGSGKQQPIDSKVQTPNGVRNIGDLKVGDEVFGCNGEIIKVNGVFPQGIKQAYKLFFRDGTYAESGEEHLWNVWTKKLRSNKKPPRTIPLKDLLSENLFYVNGKSLNYKYSIPLCNPVKYSKKELPIHPYLLGVLIGDGTYLGVTPIISTPDIDDEIIEICQKLIPEEIKINKYKTFSCPKYSFVNKFGDYNNYMGKHFRLLNLNVKSINRFIPDVYKYSSVEDRYEILKGLMDTDGSCRNNRTSFSTSSYQLMKDVKELVQSLGGIAIENKIDERYENINYTLNIKTFENPFKINRKAKGWKLSWKNPPSKYITKIEKSRIVEQVCISVDSEDGLYLTDDYIVTHNTTVIKKILDEYDGNIVVSAPTHKAKKVVINTTGQEGKTLHSLLGLRPDLNLDDFNPNNPIFNPIALPKICDYSLVIIDEASMINKGLFELIKKQTKGMYTKIIFMGDPAQIPPVGEQDSIVFNPEDVNYYQLTKVERQKDSNPIMFIYDALRENLTFPYDSFDKETRMNDKGEGVIFTKDRNEFREMLFNSFKSKEYESDTDYCKLLAWTNKAVIKSNKLIRSNLFGLNSDIIEIGDVLMGYRSVAKSKYQNIIENSADYKVVKKSELTKNKYGLYGYQVQIRENLSTNSFSFENIFIVDSNNKNNLHNYAEEHDKLKFDAKRKKSLWNIYYKFRSENIILTSIHTYRDDSSREKSEIIVKDMDYAFAITIHKSQGSTYNHVFILEDDINKNWNVKERNQIKYVAYTRPQMKAIVFLK